MTNTFISTDPETKAQKTIKIPDGCIIVEMKAKEMSDFIMKTFAGFLFVDERARLQVLKIIKIIIFVLVLFFIEIKLIQRTIKMNVLNLQII